jgi:hypothetical protein
VKKLVARNCNEIAAHWMHIVVWFSTKLQIHYAHDIRQRPLSRQVQAVWLSTTLHLNLGTRLLDFGANKDFLEEAVGHFLDVIAHRMVHFGSLSTSLLVSVFII